MLKLYRILPILSLFLILNLGQLFSQTQLGQTIFQEFPNAASDLGVNVAINANGNRIAITDQLNSENGAYAGHVRVFEYQSDEWVQMGNDIDGTGPGAAAGIGMDISGDGSVIALGDVGNSPELVRVFEWQNESWIQKGKSFVVSPPESFGSTVKLSYDGNVIIIGSDHTFDIRIYRFNGKDWILDGEKISLGCSGLFMEIGLQSDGNAFVAACSQEVDCPIYSYHYINGKWEQKGSVFCFPQPYGLVQEISLSGNGEYVFFGHEGTATSIADGILQLYRYDGLDWVEEGSCIEEQVDAPSLFSKQTAMNYHGNRIAIRNVESAFPYSPIIQILDFNSSSNKFELKMEIASASTRDLELNSKGDRLVARINGLGSGVEVFQLDCPPCSPYSYEVNTFFCNGDILLGYDGSVITEEVTLEENLTSSQGCDSTIIWKYNYIPNDTTYVDYVGCVDDGYQIQVGDDVFSQFASSGEVALQSTIGCDSVIIVDLVYQDATYMDTIIYYCQGSTVEVEINGTIYNPDNNIGVDTLINSLGCDSIITISITELQQSTKEVEYSICEDDDFSLVVGEEVFDSSNPVGDVLLINEYGCDSIVSVNIEVRQIDTTFNSHNLCENDTLIIDGMSFSQQGLFSIVEIGDDLCDSIVLYDITELNCSDDYLEDAMLIGNALLDSFIFDFDLPQDYQLMWEANELLSCLECQNPTLYFDGSS